MTDELTSLRAFRADLAEPGPDTLARVRARVDRRTARDRRGGGRGRLVPAMAAAAVLAVAVGAALVRLNSADDPPPPATHRAAVEVLERFAAQAGDGPAPLTVPAGKVLHVPCRLDYASAPGPPAPDVPPSSGPGGMLVRIPGSLDRWYDVHGMITLMTRGTPGSTDPTGNLDAITANADRDQFAKLGPSLTRPTPEFLAGLPTDPDAMLALLRTFIDTNPSWGAAPMVSTMYDMFFQAAEPLIPPRVRASLYLALAKQDSVVATGQPIDVDGRKVYAVEQKTPDARNELLLDATTGRVVGNRWINAETEPEPNIYKACTFAVVDKAGDTG